jgi:diadenosine tetraphosphate (Ap4A) HIT family hydrolase
MPENAHEIHARAAGALRSPPVQDWPTWPFEGPVRPKALDAPGSEPERDGEDGVDCSACARPDADYLWTDENWRLWALPPSGLPIVLILEPRAHYDGPSTLPDDLAREQGVMLGRVERAVLSVGEIGRVHIGRWGEGGAHLHWWFIARPKGFPQLASSMAELWDEVLPPTPEDVWRGNAERVAEAMRHGGTAPA